MRAIPCMCQCFSLQWFAVVRVKDDSEWQGGLRRQFGEDVYRLLCDRLNTQPGDLITITAGKHTNAVRMLLSSKPSTQQIWPHYLSLIRFNGKVFFFYFRSEFKCYEKGFRWTSSFNINYMNISLLNYSNITWLDAHLGQCSHDVVPHRIVIYSI